jgi:membrane-associated phospholipid phosphatase
MIASVGIYTHHKNMKLYYAFCIAILMNYFLAVPFYLFVPVNEVWFVHSQVRFLLPDVFPTFEQEYRSLSGLNNCFPSLHTSISVTLALLAAKSGIRRWAIFAWINAVVIIFSIFYLGIHWFTDMAAGVVLALLSVFVGLKVGAWAENNSLVALSERSKAKLKASRPVGS